MPKKKLVVLLIALCAFLGYFASLFNDFVYDDHLVLTNNFFIKDIKNLPRLFTPDYFLVSNERTFRPFSPVVLFCEYAVFNDNPAGYHAVNIVIHIANAVLLFLLLIMLGYNDKIALFASLLFCVHPAISETIFCISYMEDLWGVFFYLFAFLFFIKAYKNPAYKILFLILAQVCFFISLLCKEMGITAFLLIPLMWVIFYRNPIFSKKNIFSFYIPSVVSIAVYFVLRFYIFYLPEKKAVYPGGSFFVTLINIPRIFLHYLRLCFMPVNLTADYNINICQNIFSLQVIFSFFLIAVLLFFLFKLKRKNKYWALLFVINLLPVSNIIPFGAVFAERYLYFSMIGFAVSASVFMEKINSSKLKFVNLNGGFKLILSFAVLLCYIMLLNERAPAWKSDQTLWLKTLKSSPKNFIKKATFYVNLGNVFYQKNDLDKALESYMKAKEINPKLPGLYNNIGVIFLEKGKHDIAKFYFLKAINMRDSLEGAYFSLCKLYMREKNYDNAEKTMLDLLERNPDSVHALDNLVSIYTGLKHYKQALRCIEKILSIDSKYESAYINGYIIYGQIGKPQLANRLLLKGIKKLPKSIKLKNSFAENLRLQGKFLKSLSILDELVRKKIANAKTYVIRGIIYYRLKKPNLARLDFEKSLKINPNQIKVLNNLGLIYIDEGNLNKAKKCWLKSLRLNPDQKDIINSLDYLRKHKQK
ncbi:tetratricopeptide repeat protein [bacterium]|nr:tetratricopeptide repeat protein [bacterium]